MEIKPRLVGEVTISQEKIDYFKKKVNSILDLKDEIEGLLQRSVTEILEAILEGTIILKGSDLHFEPEKEEVKFRIRVDGILHDVISFDSKIFNLLLSRIKALSKLKLNVTDRPQDGRFTIVSELPIETRVSTLPSEYGETIVMRILDPRSLIDLEALGLRKDLLEIFNKEIRRPNGMIVVTGPTGSGKTTTLYAILKKISSPEIKIITIEDPIEYHLEGISQTQVDPKRGYGFASGLRAIVRQDPDVILVGEIRDLETATIALQAALTGHLVLSTLHTNDAAGTIPRLIALGENPVNIAPAINMMVAQRLVRIVCDHCKREEKIKKEELEILKKELSDLPEKISLPQPINENTIISKGRGCRECNFTGYQKRIGIYEIILNDEDVQELILKKPSTYDMKKLAKKKGFLTMKQDGLIKILEGLTTIEEVERITG